MNRSLLDVLRDPVSGGQLRLEGAPGPDEDVVDGLLVGDRGSYPIADAIPRFVVTEDHGQAQTQASFGFKWTKRDSFGSEGMQAELHRWLIERYGFESAEGMRDWFGARRRTLDAGCGAGFATSAWMTDDWNRDGAEWVGVDISQAIDVARERLGAFPGTHFVQADVMQLPFRPETFDAIISEGVLHHTPSTERALKAPRALPAHRAAS